jgi:hypothetical protein
MQRQIEQTVEQRQQIVGGEVDRWIEAGKMQTRDNEDEVYVDPSR